MLELKQKENNLVAEAREKVFIPWKFKMVGMKKICQADSKMNRVSIHFRNELCAFVWEEQPLHILDYGVLEFVGRHRREMCMCVGFLPKLS